MKRFLIIVLLLLLTGVASAQTFPTELAGDQVPDGTVIEFQMYLNYFHDRQPWSSPDPTGAIWWFGLMEFGECVDPGDVMFTLSSFATRFCVGNPWGVIISGDCYYFGERNVGNRYITLSWNDTCGCYLLLQEWNWGYSFESITIDAETLHGYYRMGKMQLEDGKFVYDLNYSIWTYAFEPRTVELKGLVRKPRARRLLNGN